MDFAWAGALDLRTVVWITVLAHVVLLVWAVARPREDAYAGAPDRACWRDLRLWIAVIVVLQVGIYAWLG